MFRTRVRRGEDALDRFERRGDAVEQALARGGQRDATWSAREQGLVEAFLERTHLVAQRADREAHLRGGTGEVLLARDRDEGLQGVQGRPHRHGCSCVES